MKNRRQFLRSLAGAPVVGGAMVAGVSRAEGAGSGSHGRRAGRPRHIIHLVADGMSAGTLALADHFSRQTRGRRLTWFELTRRAEVQMGFMDMRSQDSLVTDSSAASSAWGCGARIPNGKVNRTSRGERLVPLYEVLAEGGWKRGLVTTTEITHATPAGFAASTGSRSSAEEIAVQYLERRVDVLLGGGSKYFGAATRVDRCDVRGDYVRSGYAVLETPEQLGRAPMDRPWLGIFTAGHLPFRVDQVGGLTRRVAAPELAEMARAALGRLRGAERFVLQVEGGRVDHGAHNNDAAAAVHEMISFDEALDVVLEFQREVPETLVVVTTDHGTGNPALNGMGDSYKESSKYFRNLAGIRQSLPELSKALLLCEKREQMAERVREATGYKIPTRRLEMLDPFLRKKGYALFDGLNSDVGALGQVLANHTGISFTSTSHSSDLVPILALGPGSERFRGLVEGPQVFEHYLEFAGERFRNPQEPLVASAAVEPGGSEDVRSYLTA